MADDQADDDQADHHYKQFEPPNSDVALQLPAGDDAAAPPAAEQRLLTYGMHCRSAAFICVATGIATCFVALSPDAGDWFFGEGDHFLCQLGRSIVGVSLGVAFVSFSIPAFHVASIFKSEAFKRVLEASNRQDNTGTFKRKIARRTSRIHEHWYKEAYISMLKKLFATIMTAPIIIGVRQGWTYGFRTAALLFFVNHGLAAVTLSQTVFRLAIDRCCDCVQVVVEMMLEDANEIDWDEVARAHRQLDSNLEGLWSLRCCSMLYLPMMFGCVVVVVPVIVVGVADPHVAAAISMFMLALIGMCTMVSMSWPLARITSCCEESSSSAVNSSIKATAYSFVGNSKILPDAKINHLRYLELISSTFLGVKICGVQVTTALLANCAFKVGSQLPVLVAILKAILRNNH